MSRMGSRIYVGRLSHRASERDVEKFFRDYGRLREVILKNGYGFVEFEDDRDAEDAVYEMNGKDLCGDRVVLEMARGPSRGRGRGGGGGYGGGGYGGGGGGGGYGGGFRGSVGNSRYGPPVRTKYRVVIENLSSRISWQDLKDHIRKVGSEVCYADAHRDRKNEGIVEFASRRDMERAISKLDDTDLSGRTIRIFEDGKRSSSRGRSYSRSRSRSKRRSRSRSRSRSSRRSRSGSRRSRSDSRARKSRSKSDDRSRSRSRSAKRSRSKSPRQSRSRSRSKSPTPKRSRSNESNKSPDVRKSRSPSPVQQEEAD